MRAARLLSLSNNGAASSATDPYQAAVGCVVAIDALISQVATASALNGEQRRALTTAKGIYERRALGVGDKARADLVRDVEAARLETSDVRQRLLIALSCLRQIA